MRPRDEAVPRTARRGRNPLTAFEDRLVEEIEKLAGRPGSRALVTGIGDDAAVWQPSRSHRSVVSTDAFIENVHFRREDSLESAGRRAMGASLSDIAAMGARPVLATVSLSVPPENARDDVLALYRGIAECAAANACAIAGGDLTRAPLIAVAVTVVGEVRASNVKLRSGARPGDIVALTGPLGAARASGFHTAPAPRISEGSWLAGSAAVRAMMDVSDGLSTDLARMCVASRCGALIERVPIAPAAQDAARAAGEEPETYGLAAGEDYELLVAIKARAFGYVAARFRKRYGRELERVGVMRGGSKVFRKTADGEHEVAATGWDHFEKSSPA